MRKGSVFLVLLSLLLHTLPNALRAADPAPTELLSGVTSFPPLGVALESDAVGPQSAIYAHASAYTGLISLRDQVRLLIPIGPDESLVTHLERAESLGPGREVWWGTVEGREGSRVILARSSNTLSGSLFMPGQANYQIQSRPKGWHRVARVTPDQSHDCGVTASPEHDSEPSISTPIGASARLPGPPSQPPVLDILVAYTTAAKNGAGSASGMVALIDSLVAEVNTSFANSGIGASLRLVQSVELDYPESGNIAVDLHRLQDNDFDDDDMDNPLHGVHELRRRYGADLVCLIVEKTDGPMGIANVMRMASPTFANRAFSVVQRAYANTYLSFAHEIGHNLGCQHDRSLLTGPGLFPFSYGYRFELDHIHYRTVMASPPGLPIPYYSNPEVTFSGVPVGIGITETNSADNAESINRVVQLVSGFSDTLRTGGDAAIMLSEPLDGDEFMSPAVIECEAHMDPMDLRFQKIEFLSNDTVIGTADEHARLQWTNSIPGEYHLKARVTTMTGEVLESQSVEIYIRGTPPALVLGGSAPLPDGSFKLHLTGLPGQRYQLESSQDLILWSAWVTNSLVAPDGFEIDLCQPPAPTRFYRLVPIPYR